MTPLIGYFKGDPNDYVLAYANGRVARAGAGIGFLYWAPVTSIVSVPTSTQDAPFILNETTGNFQAITVQGQLTYRIVDPARTAASLNFTLEPGQRTYRSDDPEKLPQRLINAIQAHLRPELSTLSLEEALRLAASDLAANVLARLKIDPAVATLGVECLSLFFSAVKPTPEMAKALEAEYREGLQRRADQAIYARRAAAVEQERQIKQNELNTQVLLEERRRELVDLEGANNNKQAEYNARSNDVWLRPWRDTDPRVLLALAFKMMGENAGRIGNLTITPEILSSILDHKS
jgi:regulator of protease activity HflC (stomatin/prohibitin superfamily)